MAVIVGAAAGESRTETAARLHVSPFTVDAQRRAAVRRLGARNLPHAVYIAARSGLIS